MTAPHDPAASDGDPTPRASVSAPFVAPFVPPVPMMPPPAMRIPPRGPGQPPPPTGMPLPGLPPAAAPRRRLHPLALVGIVMASVLVVAGATAGGVSLVGALQNVPALPTDDSFLPGADGDPLVTGDEASPIAAEPMDCGGCFGRAQLESMNVDRAELEALGLTTTDAEWDATGYAAEDESDSYSESWRDAGATPAACFAVYPSAPIAEDLDDRIIDNSTIYYLGGYSDGDDWSSLNQSVRIFDADEDAVTYMTSLKQHVSGCTHYRDDSIDWESDITPAPALAVPASVTAIGWVERAPYARYYSFDVQRGNVVLRTALSTSDEISEVEYRSLVEHVAQQLATLSP